MSSRPGLPKPAADWNRASAKGSAARTQTALPPRASINGRLIILAASGPKVPIQARSIQK
jgi:hypothetical protein